MCHDTNQNKTSNFITKAFIKHNGKYSYPRTIFSKSHEKLIVTCLEHDDFLITPANHLSGQGCPKCARMQTINSIKLNQNEVIDKFIKMHGDKFDYSLFIFLNTKTKGKIKCNTCNTIFEQNANNHFQGQGCPKCGIKQRTNNRKNIQEEIIKRFIEVHDNYYGYNNFIYKNFNMKGLITCYIHGDFLQSPGHHLEGKGCPKCAAIKIGNLTRLTLEEFIKRARLIHGNRFDYSKFIYINNWTKGIIICPIHGEFKQASISHLQGTGCPSCNASKGEATLEEIFKKYNIEAKPQYNIPEIVANYEIDFYLPEYRLLVEFHGIQHYEYIPFFHDGNYTFEDQTTRDKMVRDAAIRWKYNYLEFNYKQFKHLSKEQFEEMVISSINKFKKI